MNERLLELLTAAGWQAPPGMAPGDCAVMVRNSGAVPPIPGVARTEVVLGFHLLLLGADRRPSHYARCYASDEPKFERECSNAVALSADPSLQQVMPRYRSASAGGMRLLLCDFLYGREHDELLRRRPFLHSAPSLHEVFRARDLLCQRAAGVLPGFNAAPVSLLEEAAGPLATIRARCPGVDVDVIAALLGAAAPLPPEPQHADFWSRNVIGRRGSWRLIDFEEFGSVRVPLYDVFHFMLCMARPDNHTQGLEWIGEGVAPRLRRYARDWERLLRGQCERLGLGIEQQGACLVYYVVRAAAYRLRPGVPFKYAEGMVRDVHRLAGALQSGSKPHELLDWLPRR